ncbi:helix-turn-helix domain-containing protein [Sphingobacterium sp. SG20118]|uniref:helix-turn-helix domain-containing protein n=1 Tax=Sphingobacterium sp. SG20118 TaxID=3367156 RepID=UPI0037DFC567
MVEIERIDTIKQYNDTVGVDTLHPLVSIVDFDMMPTYQYFRRKMGVYAIFLKYIKCGDMRYGCQPYDYEDGTLVFIAPGQVYGIDSKGKIIKPAGKALVFHPDLIANTDLGKKMKNYTFFSYEVNEALHLSKKERVLINDCLDKIAYEIDLNIDKYSKVLIVSYIELFLNYCMRFYDRQFITRGNVNKDILSRFEHLLHEYFSTKKQLTLGIPSVGYCAEQLNISGNYFGDLIKQETGRTALDYIHSKLINEAKIMLFDKKKPISEVAHQLGFNYQQHFTRLFKQRVGQTPNEYKKLI